MKAASTRQRLQAGISRFYGDPKTQVRHRISSNTKAARTCHSSSTSKSAVRSVQGDIRHLPKWNGVDSKKHKHTEPQRFTPITPQVSQILPPSHQQTPQINHCKGDSTQWWRHFKKLNWPQGTLQGRFRRKERVTTRGASDLNPHGGRVP